MRKKSHIALSKGIINGLSLREVVPHRFTMYVGSIWPDCTPSFLTRRHCIEDTMDVFTKEMKKFIKKFDSSKGMNYRMSFRLGKILHYVADYFTLPHNKHFDGGFKEHCVYEETLKYEMYRFVDSVNAGKERFAVKVADGFDEIKRYLLERHEYYKSLGVKEYDDNARLDCEYAYELCATVCASLLKLVGVDVNNASNVSC